MPVFIDQPDAFDLMSAIEGEDWRKLQEEGRFGQCSFKFFLEEWRKAGFKAKDDPSLANETFTVHYPHQSTAIYGWGGFNRYYVMRSGGLCL